MSNGTQFGIEQRECQQPPASSLLPLMSLEQVAELLGVSKGWVRDHATRRQPRIPVVRLGGKRAVRRFRPQDVENFINAHLTVQKEGV